MNRHTPFTILASFCLLGGCLFDGSSGERYTASGTLTASMQVNGDSGSQWYIWDAKLNSVLQDTLFNVVVGVRKDASSPWQYLPWSVETSDEVCRLDVIP